MTAIKCIDLCKFFQQGDVVIKALDHVSLDIEEGSFICLSGPSGSGKTTLLNAIGGLDKLDSGEVHFDGQRVDKLGKGPMADLRLHHIGFVFQAYNLIPVLTARENVEFVMQVQGISVKERREKSYAILREVGLEGMENRYATRPNCPAGSNNVSRLHARLSASPSWSWPMNPLPTLTRKPPRS